MGFFRELRRIILIGREICGSYIASILYLSPQDSGRKKDNRECS